MSEVLTKTAVSTSNPKSALKSNDMSAQNSSASKAPQAAPTEIKAGSRVQITGAKFATKWLGQRFRKRIRWDCIGQLLLCCRRPRL